MGRRGRTHKQDMPGTHAIRGTPGGSGQKQHDGRNQQRQAQGNRAQRPAPPAPRSVASSKTTRTRDLLPTASDGGTRDGGAHDDGAHDERDDDDGARHAGELAGAAAMWRKPATAIYGTTRDRHELPTTISASEPASGDDGYAVCRIQSEEQLQRGEYGTGILTGRGGQFR